MLGWQLINSENITILEGVAAGHPFIICFMKCSNNNILLSMQESRDERENFKGTRNGPV